MNERPDTLSQAVTKDHKELSRRLDLFIGRRIDRTVFALLKAQLHALSACHFAEELTVYSGEVDVALPNVQHFRSYHAMLDNLQDSINFGGPHSEALHQELLVLRALVNIHFREEEKQVLPVVERQIQRRKSFEFAAVYKETVAELCRPAKHASWRSPGRSPDRHGGPSKIYRLTNALNN